MSLELKPRVSFEFEVEKIIDISADGRYQVQWAPAWVSKFHLVGCEHLIQEFLQQQLEKGRCLEGEEQAELDKENLPDPYNDISDGICGTRSFGVPKLESSDQISNDDHQEPI